LPLNHLQIPPWLWLAVVVAVFAIAWWRGGRDARTAAGALLAASLLTRLAYAYEGQMGWGVALVDAGLLAVLVWVALRSPRWWPLFAAGFHLLAVVTHLAKLVDSQVSAWAYVTAGVIWGYLLALSIGFGAWRERAQSAIDADPMDTPGATRR